MSSRDPGTVFREGDEVVLAEGTYQGDLGVFLRLRDDPGWADIRERDATIRSHPVAWLAHRAGAVDRSGVPAGTMNGCQTGEIEAWEGEGGAAPGASGAGAVSMSGSETQVEWAERIKRRANEEFDRVAASAVGH